MTRPVTIYRGAREIVFLFLVATAVSIFLPTEGFVFSSAVAQNYEPTASSRPVFKKRKIKIADKIISVEVADTDERRAYGLMFRQSLPASEGMLFLFDDERERAFWMQNTLIPLSIGYFSREKTLVEVIDMKPAIIGATRPKTYPSHHKAMFALEMNVGWYERNKIRPGVSFRFADK